MILDGITPENPDQPIFGGSLKFTTEMSKEQLELAVPHKHGFSKEEVNALFDGAGLRTIVFKPSFDLILRGTAIKTFIAVGGK